MRSFKSVSQLAGLFSSKKTLSKSLFTVYQAREATLKDPAVYKAIVPNSFSSPILSCLKSNGYYAEINQQKAGEIYMIPPDDISPLIKGSLSNTFIKRRRLPNTRKASPTADRPSRGRGLGF